MLPALLVLVLALAVSPAPTPRFISMTGEAKLTFHPNQMMAPFLIVAPGKDQVGAKRAADEKVVKFVKACREAGVEQRNVTITEMGASPEYRGNEVIGYTMSRSIVLTLTDMARVDEVLTAAMRNGGSQAGVVLLQNTEHPSYEMKARQAAAQVARESAKGVTEALGAKLGLPVSVTDRTPPVESVSAGNFAVSSDGSVTTSFAKRDLTVVSQVTVQFDMEAP